MDGQADRIVAPGKTEQIKLTINTARKRKGKFTKKVAVTTNDAENRNPSLVCEGSVKVPFEMQPAAISFNQVERDAKAQRKTVRITRGEGGPLAPELAPLTNENVKASLREVEAGEVYELDVELVPPWPNRAIQAYLTLKTGVKEVPEERIRVYARVAPRLSSIPARLTIPRNIESDLDLRARLVWSGGTPGKILEVKASDPKLTAELQEGENGQQAVVVHVPKGYEPPARARHFVTVKTDDEAAPMLRIQTYLARAPQPGKPGQPTGTPGKPIIRRIEPPDRGEKPAAPGARPSVRPVKPLNGPPAEPAKPAEPAEKAD